MFPHTITIYVYQDDETYSRTVIDGVWWSGGDSVQIAEKREHSGSTTIVIPMDKAEGITITPGCYISYGEQPDITSITDLSDRSIQVSEVKINNAGWDVDNVLIRGS